MHMIERIFDTILMGLVCLLLACAVLYVFLSLYLNLIDRRFGPVMLLAVRCAETDHTTCVECWRGGRWGYAVKRGDRIAIYDDPHYELRVRPMYWIDRVGLPVADDRDEVRCSTQRGPVVLEIGDFGAPFRDERPSFQDWAALDAVTAVEVNH
jgi:hypothetical protein